MKKILPCILLFVHGEISNAQNLVPNPGFENIANVHCGVYGAQDFNTSLNYWYSPSQGTPDVFSTQINQACWNFQPNSSYAGPICLKGPQMPHTGNIFVGQFLYTIPGFNQREYIQAQLTGPMTPGNIYYAEYYVSFADYHELYTDRLGAYFSDSPVNLLNDGPMLFNPQVMASGFISDSSGWVKISGTFMATSAYNYITIGNFYDDANTSTQVNPNGSSAPGCYGAYYFVDDVTVQETKTGISENDLYTAQIFPNPFNDNLNAQSNSGGYCEIFLYDVAGRLLLKENFINTVSLNTGDLANGVYHVEVRTKDGILKQEKLIKRYEKE
ncbi:hypothetical protein BH11BAC1_BH11BAC1_04110 [soil metagenome]